MNKEFPNLQIPESPEQNNSMPIIEPEVYSPTTEIKNLENQNSAIIAINGLGLVGVVGSAAIIGVGAYLGNPEIPVPEIITGVSTYLGHPEIIAPDFLRFRLADAGLAMIFSTMAVTCVGELIAHGYYRFRKN